MQLARWPPKGYLSHKRIKVSTIYVNANIWGHQLDVDLPGGPPSHLALLSPAAWLSENMSEVFLELMGLFVHHGSGTHYTKPYIQLEENLIAHAPGKNGKGWISFIVPFTSRNSQTSHQFLLFKKHSREP